MLVAHPAARAGVKRALVQILVVVANIQMRTLKTEVGKVCLLYTSPSPRDDELSRMPSSA